MPPIYPNRRPNRVQPPLKFRRSGNNIYGRFRGPCHTVLNPSLPDDDFDEAVRIAQGEFEKHQADVVVGSSRGGAVAMNINSGSGVTGVPVAFSVKLDKVSEVS